MSRSFKIAAVAVFAAMLGFSAATSQAASVLVNGQNVGGWTVTVPKGISLVIDSDGSDDGGVIKIEKFAAFPSMEGLPITFMQNSAKAAPTIDFVNESITNLSGQGWTGFQYLLTNQSQGLGSGQATFAPPPGGIFVPPAPLPPDQSGVLYSSVHYAPTEVDYGGVQPNGSTAKWGFGTDGDLIINANPSASNTFAQVFDFKEQPVSGPLVPLPAAAWQGLAGLLSLGAMAYGKNLKKVLA
ncbi:MAG: hypothetical protein M3O30_13285 [Planctomycetota bacterium]|nr:hypothetical protein [Planctomycetota bacterium]